MTGIFQKKDLTDKEYLVKYALIYLGMKKIKEESITKILADNEYVINAFLYHFKSNQGLHCPYFSQILE